MMQRGLIDKVVESSNWTPKLQAQCGASLDDCSWNQYLRATYVGALELPLSGWHAALRLMQLTT